MIYEYLRPGKQNARTARELERVTGMVGPAIRAQVNRERRLGKLICSNETGYYLAENNADALETIRQLASRATAITLAADGMRERLMKEIEE